MAIRRRLLALIFVSLLLVFVVLFSFLTNTSSFPVDIRQPPSRTPTKITTASTITAKKVQKQDGRQKAASAPTEPPYIGDFYATEDVPEHRVCAASLRHHLKETEFFDVFLNRLPILQRQKHATEEEFRRLSRYSGANGYANVDYHTLLSSLAVLNSSSNWLMLDDWPARRNQSGSQTSGAEQLPCSRCAVVGNGGILKNSKKGKEIDAHDYVFRTNGAVIGGFEEDVGTRTTHYVFSTNTLVNSLRSYASQGYTGPPKASETRYVFIPDHDRDYLMLKAAADHVAIQTGPDKGKSPASFFGEDISSRKLKIFHPDFIRYLRNRFLRSKILQTQYKDIYRPSTGATMLLAALHSCDEVSAYGFLTWDYARYSEHYYDLHYRPLAFYANHDLRLEASLWQRLHHAHLMRLYMGEGQ